MASMRIRYRERELDVEVEEIEGWPESTPSGGGRALAIFSAIVSAISLTVAWTLREVVCVSLAAVGRVGRAVDAIGIAAARRSWLLTAIEEITERPAFPVTAVPPPLPTLPRDHDVRIEPRD